MKYKKVGEDYIVKLQRDEEVTAAFTKFADEVKLGSGFVVGIGAICDVELGYFEMKTKEYLHRKFDGEYELINLTGNFSIVDGKRFFHAHIIMSDGEFRAFAGHLFSGVIAVTGEFFVTSSSVEIARKPDNETGLNLLEL